MLVIRVNLGMKHVVVCVVVVFSILRVEHSWAQEMSTFQVWIEQTAVVNVANRLTSNIYLTEYFVGGSTSYQSVALTPSLTYAAAPWLLVEGAVYNEYVNQKDISDIIEVRPYVALRYTDALGRFEPYAFIRQEFRNIYYVDSQEWDVRYRVRLRAGTRIAITDEYISPESLYGIADVELFRNLDAAPQEYFNARIRLHGGLGYRITNDVTVEAHYMYQFSRSFADMPFDSHDNIVRATVRKAF